MVIKIVVGFTLIEVLISLLLLSSILIGFDAFCIHSLRGIRNTFFFVQATNQVMSMEERLIALKNHAGIDEQIRIWNVENAKVLPQGFGKVEGVYPQYTVQIFWGNKKPPCENTQIGNNGCIKEYFEAIM